MTEGENLRVYLRGGLGNQLFQYAAGFASAQAQGMRLLLDTSLLEESVDRSRSVTRWQEEISSFKHDGSFSSANYRRGARFSAVRIMNQVERFIGDSFGPQLTTTWGSLASEKRSLVSYTYLTHKAKIRKINSYCAHPRFFAGYQNTIRSQIVQLSEPSDFYQKMAERISLAEPIVIHLRLGDYTRLPDVFGTLSTSYFDRALDLTRGEAGDREIWVFSDEPDMARGILPQSLKRAYFVNAPAVSRPLESMLLLSKSPYKILSNSTFSWWSAFLGKGKEKVTVFPKPFLAGFTIDSFIGFLDENWTQLDRGIESNDRMPPKT